MNLDTVDQRELSALTEDDVTQVCGGLTVSCFIGGAIAGAIISDAVSNFIDGASDAIADNLDSPDAG